MQNILTVICDSSAGQMHELANHYCINFLFFSGPDRSCHVPQPSCHCDYKCVRLLPTDSFRLSGTAGLLVERLSCDPFEQRCLPHYIVTHTVRLHSWNSKPCKLYSACRVTCVSGALLIGNVIDGRAHAHAHSIASGLVDTNAKSTKQAVNFNYAKKH